jgi:hypothetical protein
MKERFGRNATAVQAHTAEAFVFLDKNDFFAEIGSQKGGGVAPWASAQDEEVGRVAG